MNPEDRDQIKRAFQVPWQEPPEGTRKSAVRPTDPPAPPASPHPVAETELPADVRSTMAPGATETILSRSLPGVDVTLTLRPPAGDALWLLEGRVWRTEDQAQPMLVVLALDDHVLGSLTVGHGDLFRFEDVLSGSWTLEFHLGNDRVVLVHGTA